MVKALYEATGGEAIITSDVGQHQMWAAQYYDFNGPRRWINSGGLGTMGFGLPAAMGAAVGAPGPARLLHRGRRLDPDEHPGARHLRAERHPGEGLRHEQRLPGHGPPVAGAVLGQQALQPRRHGCASGLREARRGLRRDRDALHRQAHARPGHANGDRDRRSGARRRPRDARGEHLPDDSCGPAGAGHGRIERRGRTSDQGAAQPGRAAGLGEPAHGPQARALDPRREQVRRTDPDRGPVRQAGLQYRHAHRRTDGGRADLARHPDGRRRPPSDRPGHEAASQARERAQDPRPRADRHGHARARALQDRRRGAPSAPRSCRSARSSGDASST